MSTQGQSAGGNEFLTEGRIVHHHAGDRCRAAIITDATSARSGGQYVSLAIFFAGQHDPMRAVVGGDATFHAGASEYDPTGQRSGSWHWPTSCPKWSPPSQGNPYPADPKLDDPKP